MNILNWLLYAGYEKSVYNEIREELKQVNRSRLIVFSTVFVAGCAVMTLSSFIASGLSGMRNTYFSFLVIGIAILGAAYTDKKKMSNMNSYLIYIFLVILFLFGIMISTVLSPTEISATYIALMLASSQLFLDKPYRIHVLCLLMNTLFIYMVITYKDAATWSSDITNASIFSLVGVLLSIFNTNTRISAFLMEKKIRELAEIDQLTGVLNRNSYELALVQAEQKAKESIYCVYLDVNGLHELNNTKGHEAGDKMLIYIARAMQSTFGISSTYRIGGDEFVAIGHNVSEAEIIERIKTVRQKIDKAGYHAAIGYSHEKVHETHIQRIVKSAETMMYADKKAYYAREGKNPQRIH